MTATAGQPRARPGSLLSGASGHSARDQADVGAGGRWQVERRCESAHWPAMAFILKRCRHAAGIDFVHQAPSWTRKLDAIMPRVAVHGRVGVDRRFRSRRLARHLRHQQREGSRNALYRNMHDGTFKDVADEMGIADVNQPGTGVSMGAVWGDYDNDGYEDLFLIKWGRPELFHNDYGHGFTRVTEQAGLPPWINANTAIWFDYDGDGLLDLFVGGYYAENIDLWHLTTTRIMPDSFEYAKNGGRKYLFHNLGNGKFEEVSAEVGIDSRRWALAAGRGRSARAPAILTCLSRTITECPSSTSTTASAFARSASRPASASRPRAA